MALLKNITICELHATNAVICLHQVAEEANDNNTSASKVDARRHDARGRLYPNLRGFAVILNGCHLVVVGGSKNINKTVKVEAFGSYLIFS